MDEKPGFWQFRRAVWYDTPNREHLHIYSNKKGDIKIYNKPKSLRLKKHLVWGFMPILFISFLSEFQIVMYNLIFDFFAALIIFNFLFYLLLYKRTQFYEIPEKEWEGYDKDAMFNKKKRGAFWGISMEAATLFLVFCLLNSYSLTSLRYLAEGGPGGNTGAAEAEIFMPDSIIDLNNEGIHNQPLRTGYTKNDISITVYTEKIPGRIYVYLNGREVSTQKTYMYPWFFWQNEYFESEFKGEAVYADFRDLNTLEVKSESFDKVWTFTVD